MSDEMSPHWMSFVADGPLSAFEYHGPWWTSGYDADNNEIVVAAVMARNEHEAFETLRLAYDEEQRPDALNERFSGPLKGDTPFSGRFPKADWMQWPWPVAPLQPRPAP